MSGKNDYISMNINVEGTVHKVKVEKGVHFSFSFKSNDDYTRSWNSCWAESDGKAGIMLNKNEKNLMKSRVEYSNEIKMTKGEFSIFKNFADNKKEQGDEIILSQDDIYAAEELYRDGGFTQDISKNLPKGYTANRREQELLDIGYIYSCICGNVKNSTTGENATVEFVINDDNNEVFSSIKSLSKQSANGEVTTDIDGEELSVWVNSYQYPDKDGKTHSIVVGDDINYVSYEEGNKQVVETYDGGQYTGKEVKYANNGKEYTVQYDENNNFKYKTVNYKNRDGINVYEKYDSNNKIAERHYENTVEYYENGKISRKNIGYDLQFNYEDGKVKTRTVKKYIEGNIVNIIYDASGKRISFDEFNINDYTNRIRSEEGQKYYEQFKDMSAKDIASEIKSQTDGPSRNAKTIAMIEGIPTQKVAQVMKEYSKTGGIWFGNKATLMTDLLNEWNMGKYHEELAKFIKIAFVSHIMKKNEDNITLEDVQTSTKVKKGSPFDKDEMKTYLLDVEKQIIK